MAEKDLTERVLEDYADVFADIWNTYIFKRIVVYPEDLITIKTGSYFSLSGQIFGMDRDVFKSWEDRNCILRAASLGLENQSKYQKVMPLRIDGYNGNYYLWQVNEIQRREREKEEGKEQDNTPFKLRPVFTLVLNFSMHQWTKNLSLWEIFGLDQYEKELQDIFHNHKIVVIDVAFTTKQQLSMMKSDFRIVADYLVQVRETGDYKGSDEEMQHAEAVLGMIAALSNDSRFLEGRFYYDASGAQKEAKNMSEVLDAIEQRGILKTLRDSVKNLKKNLHYATDLEALNAMGVSSEKQKMYFQAYGSDPA